MDRQIVTVLTAAEVPLSAYDIAAHMRESGRRAPMPSVYRSLDRLCTTGRLQKVEMMSAFRIKDHERAILAICTECGAAVSLPVPSQHATLEDIVTATGFRIGKMALEAAGLCEDCRRTGAS